MKIFTNIGLSAVAAFAFMFATSVSVVAQEKVNGSDNAEVKESVEETVLARSNKELPKTQEATIAKKMGTTVAKSADTEYYWYFVNTTGEIVSGSEAFAGELTSQADAEANPPCLPGNNSECIRGFLAPIPALDFPTSATGQATPLLKD